MQRGTHVSNPLDQESLIINPLYWTPAQHRFRSDLIGPGKWGILVIMLERDGPLREASVTWGVGGKRRRESFPLKATPSGDKTYTPL